MCTQFVIVMKSNAWLFVYRNLVYNLSLSNLVEQQRLTWFSNENDVKMCVMKGKDDVSTWFIISAICYIRLLVRYVLIVFLFQDANWCLTILFVPLYRHYRL